VRDHGRIDRDRLPNFERDGVHCDVAARRADSEPTDDNLIRATAAVPVASAEMSERGTPSIPLARSNLALRTVSSAAAGEMPDKTTQTATPFGVSRKRAWTSAESALDHA
jgi:hypothetical protein